MNKLLALALVTSFAGLAHAGEPKMPAAIKAKLTTALKTSGFASSGLQKPTYKARVTKDGANYAARVTLRAMGHDGPIMAQPQPLTRIGIAEASVDFDKKTGKQIGKVYVGGIERAL